MATRSPHFVDGSPRRCFWGVGFFFGAVVLTPPSATRMISFSLSKLRSVVGETRHTWRFLVRSRQAEGLMFHFRSERQHVDVENLLFYCSCFRFTWEDIRFDQTMCWGMSYLKKLSWAALYQKIITIDDSSSFDGEIVLFTSTTSENNDILQRSWTIPKNCWQTQKYPRLKLAALRSMFKRFLVFLTIGKGGPQIGRWFRACSLLTQGFGGAPAYFTDVRFCFV